MKSKANSDASLRNPIASGQEHTSGTNYAPSVPISVYRDLAAELQATKAMLESMSSQNQQLARQNQQFRQEIERLVQSAMNLQQIAGLAQAQPAARPNPPASTSDQPEAIADVIRQQAARSGQRPARPVPTAPPAEPPASAQPNLPDLAPLINDDLFTEQREEQLTPTPKPATKDMGSFWLTITILVIVVTAFSASFLIFRAFMPRR
jgi:hypothetical protein